MNDDTYYRTRLFQIEDKQPGLEIPWQLFGDIVALLTEVFEDGKNWADAHPE